MPRTYSDDVRVDWYRTPIDPKTLAGLMQRSDLRGWLQTSLHLGAWFGTGILAWYVFAQVNTTNWWWMLPVLYVALFLHGTVGPFMGLIAIHELQHRTVFRTRWLNGFFEQVYAFISWSDYIWYQESHARHHKATCHEGLDGEIELPITFSLRRPAFWLAVLAWYPKATWLKLKQVWRHAHGRIDGDWYNYVLPEENEGLRLRHRNWARLLLVGHALIAALFILTGNWFGVVVFTFGTQYCTWLGFLMGTPQHVGLNANAPDFRLSTRTFTCSWLPAFLYWNMQYHLEHHMYPAVPFHQLPRLRTTIAHDLPTATHGLVATWREILTIRSKAKADRDYQFVPPLPPGAHAYPSGNG